VNDQEAIAALLQPRHLFTRTEVMMKDMLAAHLFAILVPQPYQKSAVNDVQPPGVSGAAWTRSGIAQTATNVRLVSCPRRVDPHDPRMSPDHARPTGGRQTL
jgi:hypothetical protein